MRGVLPIRSSAVRLTPKSWISSAPKVEAPTSETQTGMSTMDWIECSRSGHSPICQ
jgi:hypothetical protein